MPMPSPERIVRAADLNRLAVDFDGPLIGGIGAEEDIHQRGLAGAVLAEETQNVAGMHREIDRRAGLHRTEALRDAAHADQRRRVHASSPKTSRDIGGKAALSRLPFSIGYSETGVASLTETRKSPARIACCLSMTSFMTSAGSFCSQAWKGASDAPPLAMVEKVP